MTDYKPNILKLALLIEQSPAPHTALTMLFQAFGEREAPSASTDQSEA